MKSRLFVSTVVIAVLLAGGASAQLRTQTSEVDQEACKPDVIRLCGEAIPDEKLIVACLMKNRAKVGASCKVAMNKHH